MKNLFFGVVSAAALSLFAADPSVSGTELVDTGEGTALIKYTLSGAPAIVTVDFLTNGVSIGAANFANVGGDVNRVVKPGSRKIAWQATRSGMERLLDSVTAEVKAWPLTNPPDVMVFDLCCQVQKGRVRFYASMDALPEGGLANAGLYSVTNMVFRRVHAGGKSFRMGYARSYAVYGGTGYQSRSPEKYVSFSRDYYMAVYPLTCGQWKLFGDWSPIENDRTGDLSVYALPRTPLSSVNWMIARGVNKGLNWPNDVGDDRAEDVDAYYDWGGVNRKTIVGAIRSHIGLSRIDLPTQAQWEFACRAGGTHHYYKLAGELEWDTLPNYSTVAAQLAAALKYGWNKASEVTRWQDVGQKEPNAFGFYDMLGNVYEIVLDRYAENWGLDQFLTDPRGATTGGNYLACGGCYRSEPDDCRVWTATYASRAAGTRSADIGVRLAAPVDVSDLAE